MKEIIYRIILLIFLTSCIVQKDMERADNQQDVKTIQLSDPDQFIGKYKAKAMILGVFHFDNPGLDTYQEKFPFNILEDNRQKELNILLEKIAKYKPTKILLESNRVESDSILNAKYQAYLTGKYDISNKRSEYFQIGFRLAEKSGHARIYSSDASAEWFGADLDWDNYDTDAYLKSRGQYEKSNRYDFETFYHLSDSLKSVKSLIDYILITNNPKDRLKDHQAYLTKTILEGAGDNYIGADGVARWYRRNLRIFANAYDLTDFDKEVRLLLIYGAGHVWQLRQLFLDSPDYEYIEVNEYLSK
ncbi:hypothetical protein SDC9_15531 [bioreactor metagenome]|uniref:Uncharacterized protein n=1 Tax=bioreactor metagenome TaxID=1076179 RepID=A0A644TU57_9ZZZZ|nr:DUF5694 domain-containing protein [Lentimicrobium sp.]MEA5111167.1 DUF5694 domain-containing protein [Lentimicrobium sp.]